MNKWKLTSRILSFQRKHHPIRLFNKSKSSIYDAIRDIDDDDDDQFKQVRDEGSSIRCIRRTRSTVTRYDHVSNDENDDDDDANDIDKRAEMFIANFRRQLRLERQISLELRYCK
ncbi:hypothetical protein HAX54_006016 [Datura stramonium]|uniref:Cotton fiber protein n=1 Tax=Datura stramonium TaxID=4076 RepID=A0ABS8RIE3_DATST|nr:hypothetical protein [Datura stramonium]